MRIALINSRLSLFGGLETRLFNYINYFSQKGDDVSIIVYKVDDSIRLPAGVTIVKLNLKWIPKPFRRTFFNKKVSKYMKNNKFDFSLSLGRTSHQDAVLAPSSHLGYIKAMGIKKLRKTDKDQIFLDKIAYKNSSIIYACSDLLRNELIESYIVPENKVATLYPPLNVGKYNRQFLPQREILRRHYGMKDGEKAFIFVSTGHKRKGLELLFQIFNELEGTNNVLYIAGSPEVKSDCKNIKYVGFEKESNKLFTAGDITIHPAKYEPFGQIISESLACGTPVVISSMVGAKEIITPKIGVVIDDFLLDSWVQVVQNIKPEDFDIPHNFVEKHNLSTRKHIEKMMDIWEKKKINAS